MPGSLTSSITATFSDPVTGEKAAYEEFVERGGFAARFVMPALAKPLAETAFDEWLGACNRDGRAALTEFNAHRFGEPEHNIDDLLDSREEAVPAARMGVADEPVVCASRRFDINIYQIYRKLIFRHEATGQGAATR